MHVREFGAGNAVLLLHGMPSPASELVPMAEALSASHRVLLPDLPGYGGSARLDPYTMSGAQLEIEALLRQRGLDRLAVVRFSAGAYRGLRLALDGRVRVTRVGCIGGTPGPRAADAGALVQGAAALRAGADLNDLFVARFLSETARGNPRAAAAVRAWLTAAPNDVVAAELEAFVAAGDVRTQLSRLSAPVLLRVGEHDVATPPDLSREIAGAVADARLEVVPGCGHALLVEDERATIDSIRTFLSEA